MRPILWRLVFGGEPTSKMTDAPGFWHGMTARSEWDFERYYPWDDNETLEVRYDNGQLCTFKRKRTKPMVGDPAQ